MSNFPLYLASVRLCCRKLSAAGRDCFFNRGFLKNFSAKHDLSNEKKVGLIVAICRSLVQELSLRESQSLSSFRQT